MLQSSANAAGAPDEAFRARSESLEALLLIESVEQAQALADTLLQQAGNPAQRLAAQLARAQTLLMAVRHAEAVCNSLLERDDLWSVVREPAPIQHLLDPGEECCSIPDARFPDMEIAETPKYVESGFANQLKTLPVRLRP